VIEQLGGLAGWVLDVIQAMGAVGVAALVALENVFPPLPSEVILPLAGFTASRGTFGLGEAIAWTTAGSVVGALVLYLLGALLGRERVRRGWARLPLVDPADLDRTEAWFARHGRKAVFLGRMVPLFRSLVSVPAGVDRMPLWQFLGLTLAGSLVWNSLFVLAGYELGEQWFRIEAVVGAYQYAVLALVAVALSCWVVLRLRSRRRPGPRRSRGDGA
jgi:membrane protein DedA with SNARE-associated domain